MSKGPVNWIKRAGRSLSGVNLLRGEVHEFRDVLQRDHAQLMARLDWIDERMAVEIEMLREDLDRLDDLRAELDAARLTPDYAAPFDDAEPLVTVRISSYKRTKELIDIAIASVLAQTYERFEIVIVNDGPNAATAAALDQLGDPRIRFEALPARGHYPEHPRSRWMVAGTPPANRGIELASGAWIAPLDEDDEFTPDHIETLLALAQRERVELAHGALLQRNTVNGESRLIWSDPPAISQFSFQGALYHRALRMFRYEPRAWTISEPGDWNLIRRMLAAGVTTAATQQVVGTMWMTPYTHKDA